MADDSHVIRGVNWRETFPFTQIFRAFRVAIHPTKLILALVALLSLYVGGRVLDAIWPVQDRAVPAFGEGPASRNEVQEFEVFSPGAEYSDFAEVAKARRKQLEEKYVTVIRDYFGIEKDDGRAHDAARSGNLLAKVKEKILEERNKTVDDAAKARDAAKKAAGDAYDAAAKNGSDDVKRDEARKRDKLLEDADKSYNTTVRTAYKEAYDRYEKVKSIKGDGIFAQFFNYEVSQINNVAFAVVANDWLGGFGGNSPVRTKPGVIRSIFNVMTVGPWWMARHHTVYFVLFIILFSVVWAIFGGAISRIAAVHVARDEKISLSSALRFSTSKFLSFIFAPIIPLLIVLVVGLVVAAGALLGNIPVIGPILVGLFFFLALAAGFVMTLVMLGTGGGFNLMYPTIAVEGSDSFDAISRSFSYVYARPWRMLFYTLVAVLYGALCYVFVRNFVTLMLALTHHFVDVGMFSNVDSRAPIELWNTMWPAPTGAFTYDIDAMTLGPAQSLAAFLVSIWVYLTVGLVGAFGISFYFSANTIIYFLMRREVDATELDDVYLEQSEDDFADAPAAPATTAPDPVPPPANPV